MPKTKYTEEMKLEIVKYIEEGGTQNQASEKYFVDKSSVQKWYRAYEQHGVAGLLIKQNDHNKYDGNFKVHVVEYKHTHHLSIRQTAAYFNIPSHGSVSSWERKYLAEGKEAFMKENRGKANHAGGTVKGKPKQYKKKENLPQEDLLAEVKRLRMENEYLKKLNALIQEKELSAKKKKVW